MTTTTTERDTALRDLINREVNALRADLHTRRTHPTYGIRKGDLRSRLDRVRGMLAAYAVATGLVEHTNGRFATVDAAAALEVPLADLARQVRAA